MRPCLTWRGETTSWIASPTRKAERFTLPERISIHRTGLAGSPLMILSVVSARADQLQHVGLKRVPLRLAIDKPVALPTAPIVSEPRVMTGPPERSCAVSPTLKLIKYPLQTENVRRYRFTASVHLNAVSQRCEAVPLGSIARCGQMPLYILSDRQPKSKRRIADWSRQKKRAALKEPPLFCFAKELRLRNCRIARFRRSPSFRHWHAW